MLYTDAEPGLTSNQTQSWLKRQKNVAHNIPLRHAPVAERMIGHIKNQIIKALRGTNNGWWEVVDAAVKDYNENHVSRSKRMTPREAEKKENHTEVKAQLESIRKTGNPQPRIAEGDKVKVVINKKFENKRATCRTGATRSTPFGAYQRVATKLLSRIYRTNL